MESFNIQQELHLVGEALIILHRLNEGENTFEWDIAKKKIDKSLSTIDSESKAKAYLNNFVRGIQSLPKAIKRNVAKYVFISLLGVLPASEISNYLPSDLKDLGLTLFQSEKKKKEAPR